MVFTRSLRAVALVSSMALLLGVKSVSSDGEATVYVTGDFSGRFDVAYRAKLEPQQRNRSWSTLSVLLIGSKVPGPGVSVGIANGSPNGATTTAFTTETDTAGKFSYSPIPQASCSRGCVLELQGDARSYRALINGRTVATWRRSDLQLRHPSLQLNAEAHVAGDGLSASLHPLRMRAAGRQLAPPTCAFTTRGIEPSGGATISFRGTTNAAEGEFVSLKTGAHGDRC